MITEDYCSYEVAKLLKEKGFDKFNAYGWDKQLFDKDHPRNFSIGFDNKKHWISCPSQSMAMKWLREVHNIDISIFPTIETDMIVREDYNYAIYKNKTVVYQSCSISHEEAVEAALKYSLENLI